MLWLGNSISGYNLKELGFYFGINDYIDLKLTTVYLLEEVLDLELILIIKKCKYNGGININFSKAKLGKIQEMIW